MILDRGHSLSHFIFWRYTMNNCLCNVFDNNWIWILIIALILISCCCG